MTRVMRLMTLAVLAAASLAPGAATTALDALTAAVLDRRAAIEPATRPARREYRALGRIAHELAVPTTTLAGDLAVATRAARLVRRDFREDPELPAIVASMVADLGAAARADRDRLALWTGRVAAGDEARLASGIAAADREFDRAAARASDAGRARRLTLGCRAIDATRESLDLWTDPDPPPPPPPVMPDFSIADVNPASPTHGRAVSPRDYVDRVSAWYFGRAG